MRKLDDVLKGLYASEINFGLQAFWDGGVAAWLGDSINGKRIEHSGLKIEELADWLHSSALRYYPESDYAKANP